MAKATSVKGMENDYSNALHNATQFLGNASSLVNDADAPTLARIGNGWATLALALSQDRQTHAIAEASAAWLASPTPEGLQTLMGLTSEWLGVAPPEIITGAIDSDSDLEPPPETPQEQG